MQEQKYSLPATFHCARRLGSAPMGYNKLPSQQGESLGLMRFDLQKLAGEGFSGAEMDGWLLIS